MKTTSYREYEIYIETDEELVGLCKDRRFMFILSPDNNALCNHSLHMSYTEILLYSRGFVDGHILALEELD